MQPVNQPSLDEANPCVTSTVFLSGLRGGHGAHTTEDCTLVCSNPSPVTNNGEKVSVLVFFTVSI